MITEDYVSFKTAKLLKEKGFECEKDSITAMYNELGKFHPLSTAVDEYYYDYNDFDEYDYVAPTIQMAMKWLREVHNQIIVPGIRVEDPITGIIDCYCVGIHYIPKNNGGALCFTSPTPESGYSSCEEACEAGIKYCLENLI